MTMPDQVVIFAAGLGERMRPLTVTTPKPLLKVNGKPLLYYALEIALTVKLRRIIINSHYLAPQISSAVEGFRGLHSDLPEIIVTHEPTLLGSGGTIKSLERYFGHREAIFTINSDSIIESPVKLLAEMREMWDSRSMDFLMLVHEAERTLGSKSHDFALQDGLLVRNAESLPYMYTGLQILSTNIAIEQEDQVFSLGRFHRSDSKCRRGGIINQGMFAHMSTPQDLLMIDAMHHSN